MPHLGIAVATTLGGWVNAGLLYRDAGQARPLRRRRPAEARAAAIVLASLVMGAALWLAAAALAALVRAARAAAGARWLRSRRWSAPGSLVYAVAVLALGALDLRQLRGLLRRSRSAGRPDQRRAWPCAARACAP